MIFSNYDNEKTDVQRALEIAKEAVESAIESVKKYHQLIDAKTGKILPVTILSGRFNPCRDVASYATIQNTADWRLAVNAAIEEANEIMEKIKVEHAKNLAAMDNNKAVIEKIHQFMSNVGISKSNTGVTETRNRELHTEKDAGYITDIRNIITDDKYDIAVKEYQSRLRTIKMFETEKELKENLIEREQEREKAKIDYILTEAMLREKYKFHKNATLTDMLYMLLQKNKYLKLGHFMKLVSEGWNGGIDVIKSELKQFEIDEEIDTQLHYNIFELIDNWNNDGEVFVRGEFSFIKLFEMVDEELMGDYIEVCRHLGHHQPKFLD